MRKSIVALCVVVTATACAPKCARAQQKGEYLSRRPVTALLSNQKRTFLFSIDENPLQQSAAPLVDQESRAEWSTPELSFDPAPGHVSTAPHARPEVDPQTRETFEFPAPDSSAPKTPTTRPPGTAAMATVSSTTPTAITRSPLPLELRQFEEANITLRGQQKWLTDQLNLTRTQSREAESVGKRVAAHFERVRRKQAQTGLTTTLGLILHHEREHLPNIRKWQRELGRIKDRLHTLSELEFELERQERHLADYESDVSAAASKLASRYPSRRTAIAEAADRLNAQHRRLLAETLASAQAYADELTTFDSRSSELVKTTENFEAYINKNVLWIRSNDPIGAADFKAISPLADSLSEPGEWWQAGTSVLTAIREKLPLVALCVLAVLITTTFGSELSGRLDSSADRAASGVRVRLMPTFEAFAITCLLALAWPALIWTVGSALTRSLYTNALGLASGQALQIMATWYAAFSLPRHLCRPGGVAERHFRWKQSGLEAVFHGLPRVMVWGLPVVAFVAFLSTHEHGRWSGSVGRLGFVCGALVLAWFAWRAMDPRTGFVVKMTTVGSRMYRMRHAALCAAVAVPLAMAITSAAGYHHSALELSRCMQHTWTLIIALTVGYGFLVKGLDWVVQSFETGTPVVAFPFKARVMHPTGEEVSEAAAQLEFARSREQVYRFVHTATVAVGILACWGIWNDVLPALNVVNDVRLWQMSRDVPVAAGSAEVVRQVVPVTLGDVIRALVILTATIVASRNLPGLLDTLLLRRLPFDRGGRHAIATICRYLLTSVGVVLTLGAVGVDWASLQWLVAAMTVGLGFGLQEIFANFVSGLIILLERPVRIGDFVTVNGETGFVTRIQFRATTITDLDRRELLVPNKKFITDELINWTLSDPITRLVVPIGIAYGSDTGEAHRLLLEVADEHAAVLKEPEPSAVMTSFGDSTLNFELRVFIPRREEFAQILHEINTAIERKFRTAHIEIAFPQCDINVRGLEQFAAAALKRAA